MASRGGNRGGGAQNARGSRFHWKSLHFLHEDDFSNLKPILKFCDQVMDADCRRSGLMPANRRRTQGKQWFAMRQIRALMS